MENGVRLALVAVSVILLVSLVANGYLMFSDGGGLQNQNRLDFLRKPGISPQRPNRRSPKPKCYPPK